MPLDIIRTEDRIYLSEKEITTLIKQYVETELKRKVRVVDFVLISKSSPVHDLSGVTVVLENES